MERYSRTEFAEAWRRFEACPRTRPSLAAVASEELCESDYLLYLVVLDHEPEIARTARLLQRHLEFPYVIPVPHDALHITLQGVGCRATLSPEQQAALVEGAAPVLASLSPFDVTVGGANSFDQAAFLEVHDGGALRDVRAKLRTALPWLAEDGRDPLVRDGVDTYLPHVSVAYYNREADARPVVAALAPHRDETVGRVRITSVQLVAVRLPLPSEGVRYAIEARFDLSEIAASRKGQPGA